MNTNIRNNPTFLTLLMKVTDLASSVFYIDEFLNRSLEEIGLALKIDRVWVAHWKKDTSFCRKTHQWQTSATTALNSGLKSIDMNEAHWWRESIISGRRVYLEDVSQIADSYEKTFLFQQKIHSLLAIPLYSYSNTLSFLCIEKFMSRIALKDEELEMLQVICRIISMRVEKEQFYEKINNLEKLNIGNSAKIVQQKKELELYTKFGFCISKNGDLDESIRDIMELFIDYFDMDFAAIYLQEDNFMRLWKAVDVPEDFFTEILPFSNKNFLINPKEISDEIFNSFLTYNTSSNNLKGKMVFPLYAEDEFYGFFMLGTRRTAARSYVDQQVINNLGQQIGSFIESSFALEHLKNYSMELNRQFKERTFELEILYELSREIVNSPDYGRLVELIINALDSIVQFDLAGYILCIDNKSKYVVEINRPIKEHILKSFSENLKNKFIEITADQNILCPRQMTRIVKGIDYDETDTPADGEIQSYFYVPLKMEDKVVGILNISSFKPDNFTHEHIRILNTIALQASMSLTQLKQFLETRKTTFESILENFSGGVVLLDRSYSVKMANPAGEKMLKKLAGVEVGDYIKNLAYIPIENLVEDILWNNAESKKEEIIVSGVTTNYYKITVSPFRLADSRVIGAIIALQDITEEKMANQQLMQMDRMASVGELAAGVAHEINNPLTGILGFSEMLLKQEDISQEVREVIEDIYSSSKRAAQITEDLLYFAHDQKEKNKEVIDLHEILDKTLKLVETQYQKYNITIKRKYEDEKIPIYGISGKIQQVLLNLFTNSKDAILSSKKGSRITIYAGKDDKGAAQLIVEDDGPGIKNEVLERIFDPFFTTKDVGKGTGLGLSITYRIIKDHGGNIFTESEEGKFTRFTVTFPPIKQRETLSVTQEKTEKTIVEKLKILAVDDELMILKFINKYYTKLGFQVETANSPQKGIEMIKEGSYDLILIDFRMPEMTGEEMFRRIMEIRPDVKDKIVMVTGDVMGAEVKSFLEESKIRYLLKPIELKDLRTLVEISS